MLLDLIFVSHLLTERMQLAVQRFTDMAQNATNSGVGSPVTSSSLAGMIRSGVYFKMYNTACK